AGPELLLKPQVQHRCGAEHAAVEVVLEALALVAEVGGECGLRARAPYEPRSPAPFRRLAWPKARLGDFGLDIIDRRTPGDALAKVAARLRFQPQRFDRACVLALPIGAAGRHEDARRKHARALPERYIDDGVLEAVDEEACVPPPVRMPGADPDIEAEQALRLQRRIGFGDVVADAEGAVKLVERGRAKAPINGPAEIEIAQRAPNPKPRRGRNRLAVFWKEFQRRRPACEEALDALAVLGAGDVDARAAGQEPWSLFAPGFGVEPARQRAPARDARAREGAAREREQFLRLAVRGPEIGAQLEPCVRPRPAHRRVGAPAERGRRALVRGR